MHSGERIREVARNVAGGHQPRAHSGGRTAAGSKGDELNNDISGVINKQYILAESKREWNQDYLKMLGEKQTSTGRQHHDSQKMKSSLSHRHSSAGTPRGENGDCSSKANRRSYQIEQIMKHKKNCGEPKFQKIVLKRNNKPIGQMKKLVSNQFDSTHAIPSRFVKHARNLSGQSNNSSFSRTIEKMRQALNPQQSSAHQLSRDSLCGRDLCPKGIPEPLEKSSKMITSQAESKYQKLKQRQNLLLPYKTSVQSTLQMIQRQRSALHRSQSNGGLQPNSTERVTKDPQPLKKSQTINSASNLQSGANALASNRPIQRSSNPYNQKNSIQVQKASQQNFKKVQKAYARSQSAQKEMQTTASIKNYFNKFLSQNLNQNANPTLLQSSASTGQPQASSARQQSQSVWKSYDETGRLQAMIKTKHNGGGDGSNSQLHGSLLSSAGKKVGRFSHVDQTATFQNVQVDAQEKSRPHISRRDQQKSSRLNSDFQRTADVGLTCSKGDSKNHQQQNLEKTRLNASRSVVSVASGTHGQKLFPTKSGKTSSRVQSHSSRLLFVAPDCKSTEKKKKKPSGASGLQTNCSGQISKSNNFSVTMAGGKTSKEKFFSQTQREKQLGFEMGLKNKVLNKQSKLNALNKQVHQVKCSKLTFDKAQLKLKDLEEKIAQQSKQCSDVKQKSILEPEMETERPPKINNRESLLPPRLMLNKNSETVISSTISTTAFRERPSISETNLKERPSVVTDQGSSQTMKEAAGANNHFSMISKSKSFINKTALKKLINEQTQRSQAHSKESRSDQKKKEEQQQDSKKDQENDDQVKGSDFKNESLKKLNQDLNDYFDQKQLDIMGFLKDREKIRKIEQKNNRIKIQQIQEKLAAENNADNKRALEKEPTRNQQIKSQQNSLTLQNRIPANEAGSTQNKSSPSKSPVKSYMSETENQCQLQVTVSVRESQCSLDMSNLTFLTQDKMVSMPTDKNKSQRSQSSLVPSMVPQNMREFHIKKLCSINEKKNLLASVVKPQDTQAQEQEHKDMKSEDDYNSILETSQRNIWETPKRQNNSQILKNSGLSASSKKLLQEQPNEALERSAQHRQSKLQNLNNNEAQETRQQNGGDGRHRRHHSRGAASRHSRNCQSSNNPTNQISEIPKESFESEGDFDQYNFDNSCTHQSSAQSSKPRWCHGKDTPSKSPSKQQQTPVAHKRSQLEPQQEGKLELGAGLNDSMPHQDTPQLHHSRRALETPQLPLQIVETPQLQVLNKQQSQEAVVETPQLNRQKNESASEFKGREEDPDFKACKEAEQQLGGPAKQEPDSKFLQVASNAEKQKGGFEIQECHIDGRQCNEDIDESKVQQEQFQESSEKRHRAAHCQVACANNSLSLIHQQSSARPKDQTPYLMTFNDGQTFQQMFDLKENSRMLNSTQTFKKRSNSGRKANEHSSGGRHNDNMGTGCRGHEPSNEINSPVGMPEGQLIRDAQKEEEFTLAQDEYLKSTATAKKEEEQLSVAALPRTEEHAKELASLQKCSHTSQRSESFQSSLMKKQGSAAELDGKHSDDDNKRKFKPLSTAYSQKQQGQDNVAKAGSFVGGNVLDNASFNNESSQQRSVSVNYFKNLKENSMRQLSQQKPCEKRQVEEQQNQRAANDVVPDKAGAADEGDDDDEDDLSVYEDNDEEDSSDMDMTNEHTEELTSPNNSTKNAGDTAKFKKIKKLISGYKLMKQMEDSRDNFTLQKSGGRQPQTNASQSINYTLLKRSKPRSTEALEKSLESNKELLFIQQTTDGAEQPVDGEDLDGSGTKQSSQCFKNQQTNQDLNIQSKCTGGFPLCSKEKATNQSGPKTPQYTTSFSQQKLQMGAEASFGMLDTSNANMVNNYIQGDKQFATLDARQTSGDEFFQEFKIGNYGKRETGMAPSIQMQNRLMQKVPTYGQLNPLQRQRPQSMMVKQTDYQQSRDLQPRDEILECSSKFEYVSEQNQQNIPMGNQARMTLQELQHDSTQQQLGTSATADHLQRVNMTEQNSNNNSLGFSFSKNLSEDQKARSLMASQQAAKRRKIRPISSLQGKKAKLPDCFIQDPFKNIANSEYSLSQNVSKRVASAHHSLNQSNKLDLKEQLLRSKISGIQGRNEPPPISPQPTYDDKVIGLDQLAGFNNIPQEQVKLINQRPAIPRPESSYGKKGRLASLPAANSLQDSSSEPYLNHQVNHSKNDYLFLQEPATFHEQSQPESCKNFQLDKKDFKKVFHTPLQLHSKNPNARKPPRIQSGLSQYKPSLNIQANGQNYEWLKKATNNRLISSAIPGGARRQQLHQPQFMQEEM